MISKFYDDYTVSTKMRANWDQAEALILSANEHQQKLEEQQQQHHQPELAQHHTIVEASTEHRHPLQSATTPAWGTMADAIVVKEEPHHDDKNNDSGISPGHYMSESASPNSRRSSTVNCSLSPGSATSQDSHNLPIMTGYEYSPQNVYKQCDSPPEFTDNGQPPVVAATMEENSMNQDASQHALTSDIVSSSTGAIKSEDTEHIECSPDPLQCPVCVFSTQSRLRFSEHLKSHCTAAAKFDESEFTKSVMEQLTNGGSIGSPEDISRASPTQNERTSDHEVEEADEPGLRVPRVNSQGKVKTFRCKQCDFVAITKLDFWEHTRSHIKIEKLLTCPKCPFVTEYKHHLEYHLRNHVGSKPYKCDKCSYSCVNKSMLNSHLKSHSNVYQFRCSDCAYATKYCHSLKLHLRKYKHNPAMVLNADGSPNPLPIIDVYGTRRGPKAKPKKDAADQQQQAQQQAQPQMQQQPQQPGNFANGMMPTVVPQQAPMQQMQFQFNPLNGINGLPKLNGFNGFNGASPAGGLGLTAPANLMGFPYNPLNPLFAGFPLPNPFSLGAGAIPEQPKEQQMELFKANLIEAAKSFTGAEAKLPEEQQQQQQQHHSEPEVSSDAPMTESPAEQSLYAKQEHAEPPAPLDLSKSEVAAAMAASRVARGQAPAAGQGTSRRKGRAVKLDKRVLQNDSDEEMRDEHLQVLPPSVSPASSADSKDSKDSASQFAAAVGMSSEFTCQYCDISFGNEIMHSVHMGYHGYQNPYTCNMCGIQCSDKVSFFLHIARSKH